jgi:ribosomal protein S19E (S16A)
MSYTPKTVKDVDAQAFIKAYAKHLKQQGKVRTHRAIIPFL